MRFRTLNFAIALLLLATVPAIGQLPPGQPLTLTDLTANPPTPLPPGSPATFTATASGGTPPYQYRWFVFDGGAWHVHQDWSPSNSYTWANPSPPNPSYQIGVWVRSADNPAPTFDRPESTGWIRYPVGAPPATPPPSERMEGSVQSIQGPRLVVRAADGRIVHVDLTHTGAEMQHGIQPGSAVAVTGQPHGSNSMVAQDVRPLSAPVARQPAGPPLPGEWRHVHGHVQSVQGQNLTFRADDGRVLNVDMQHVNPEIQQAMRPGIGATLVGSVGPQPNQFTARYIQQDASDPARGGAVVGQPPVASPPAVPPGPPPPSAGDWQQVDGTVQGIRGQHLVFRSDDGRQMTVDVTRVNPEVRAALQPGARVTLVGFPRGQDFTAHYIQQHGAAASPRTRR